MSTFDTALTSALQELGYILSDEEMERMRIVSRHVAVKMLEEARSISEENSVKWWQQEGSYAAGKKAGAIECMKGIEFLISQVKGD